MAQIRITPEQLREASQFLSARLESINSEVQQLKSKIDEVTAEWEGAAQSAFVTSFEEQMYPILRDTLPEVVEGICTELESASDTLEDVDMQIAKQFGHSRGADYIK